MDFLGRRAEKGEFVTDDIKVIVTRTSDADLLANKLRCKACEVIKEIENLRLSSRRPLLSRPRGNRSCRRRSRLSRSRRHQSWSRRLQSGGKSSSSGADQGQLQGVLSKGESPTSSGEARTTQQQRQRMRVVRAELGCGEGGGCGGGEEQAWVYTMSSSSCAWSPPCC